MQSLGANSGLTRQFQAHGCESTAERPMQMENHPLSTFFEVVESTAGGAIAFCLGLAGGSTIVWEPFVSLHSRGGVWGPVARWHLMDHWFIMIVGWIGLVPYTVGELWGLLLLPALMVIFYGLFWKDWNRLICASTIAILLAATGLLSMSHHLFDDWAIPIKMGIAVLLLTLGIGWELLKRKRRIIARAPRHGRRADGR